MDLGTPGDYLKDKLARKLREDSDYEINKVITQEMAQDEGPAKKGPAR